MRHFTRTKLHLLLALALAVPVVAVPATATPATASVPDIELIGELEFPWVGPDENYLVPRPVHVDAERQRLYVIANRAVPTNGSAYLAEYDTSTQVPRPLRISEDTVVSNFALQSSNTAVFQSKRNRLLVATYTRDEEAYRSVIDLVDLDRLERAGRWDMTTTLPGFLAAGLTYDESADLVYVVGDFTGLAVVDEIVRPLGLRPVSPGPAVVALDGETGAVRWIRPLDGCNEVLKPSVGAVIGLSELRPVLYTFCDGGGIAAQQASVGQNSLIRIHIDPDASAAEAATFPIDVFPVSGNYVANLRSGVAGFDPVSERFIAQSIAPRTPGGWIFDGLSSTWVGFVAAPGGGEYLGIDSVTGRYYLGGKSDPIAYQDVTNPKDRPVGYINVTGLRATPIAQGSLTVTPIVTANILTDAGTGRLFVPGRMIPEGVDVDEAGPTDMYDAVAVMQDNSAALTPPAPLDLDELTVDLPDEQVRRDVNASAAGYGARYELVGGVEGTYARTTGSDPSQSDPSGLARGDRGITLAPVPRVDLRNAGASATASAAAIDRATDSDLSDTSREVEGDDEEGRAMRFPYEAQTCLDAGGGSLEQEQEQPPGRARVSCDLESTTVSASAAHGEATSAGGVDVARATFDTEVTDTEAGGTSTATAVAEGIAVRLPDGQRLAVERVTTVATVAADGRPGTSTAEWTRSVEGVSLVDAEGKSTALGGCTTTVTAEKDPTGQDECDALSEAITDAVGSRMQVRFPLPAASATPRGAFAQVAKSDDQLLNDRTVNNEDDRAIPGMRVIVFADGAEKSRLLVNLAAIDLTATVIRTETYTPPPPPDTSETGGSAQDAGHGTTTDGGTTGGTTGAAQTDSATGGTGSSQAVGVPGAGGGAATDAAPVAPAVAGDGAGGQQVVAAPAQPATWLVGTRSLGEAGTAAAVWMLFAWPLFVGMRRRNLLSAA